MKNIEAYYKHEQIIHKDLSDNNLDSLVTISVDKDGNVASSHSVDNSNIYVLLGALEQMKLVLMNNYIEL